jgi:two-component system, NarL family, response regulator NreC
MDAAMPVLNGIEATRQIITAVPQSKITALSMHNDKRYILEMLKAGASGYMLKECAYEELVGTIRTVLDNRTYLSPSVNEIVINDYRLQLQRDKESTFAVLTSREREILQLLAEGSRTSHMAEQLHVSPKTIETHRQNIMAKLNITKTLQTGPQIQQPVLTRTRVFKQNTVTKPHFLS